MWGVFEPAVMALSGEEGPVGVVIIVVIAAAAYEDGKDAHRYNTGFN
jgi:hypothetical protein